MLVRSGTSLVLMLPGFPSGRRKSYRYAEYWSAMWHHFTDSARRRARENMLGGRGAGHLRFDRVSPIDRSFGLPVGDPAWNRGWSPTLIHRSKRRDAGSTLTQGTGFGFVSLVKASRWHRLPRYHLDHRCPSGVVVAFNHFSLQFQQTLEFKSRELCLQFCRRRTDFGVPGAARWLGGLCRSVGFQ